MKTTVERVDETTVKLSVTVEAERVEAALDHAAEHLAQEVRIPGFRPGRVPRKILEARLGPAALVQEAVREALPTFYAEAATSEQLEVVSQPEFDDVNFEPGTEASFTATVQVRPEIQVPDYAGLQVPYPDWEVTDEEVDHQLDAMRERYAELETVERSAEAGDYVVITMSGERDGETVEEVSHSDYLYLLPEDAGTDTDDSQLHQQLVGASAGDVLSFTDTLSDDYGEELAGAEIAFTTELKEVKSKTLPELDDDFALTASEFDTIDELRDELRASLATQKRAYAAASLRGNIVEAVCDLVEVPLPSGLVDEEVRFRLNRLASQAQQQGVPFDQYLGAMGLSAEQLMEEMSDDARKTVKAQLVVDAIGRAADVDVDQQDLGEEVARQAARVGQPIEEVARFMTHPDRLPALVSDAFRRKTIDYLVESVQVLGGPPPEAEADTDVDDTADQESTADDA